MITIFDIKFTSSEGLRKALNLWGSKWCAKVDIKDLLRMAFPSLDANQIKKVLLSFIDTGKFSIPPSPPKAIYENYCAEFGCSFPFDVKGQVLSEQKLVAPQQQKQQLQVETMNTQQNEEYSQIKNALLNEIAIIQDTKNYTNDNGEIDTQKADMLFKRAEAVNNIAGSLNDMKKTEIEVKRLQLDAVRTALSHGYEVKVNGNLLGVEIK
ncbi:MAG: hypothetical protein MR366_05420 [Succinivibrio sp.]|nr:hypothetical protein [Succinivibrio sp.]